MILLVIHLYPELAQSDASLTPFPVFPDLTDSRRSIAAAGSFELELEVVALVWISASEALVLLAIDFLELGTFEKN